MKQEVTVDENGVVTIFTHNAPPDVPAIIQMSWSQWEKLVEASDDLKKTFADE